MIVFPLYFYKIAYSFAEIEVIEIRSQFSQEYSIELREFA